MKFNGFDVEAYVSFVQIKNTDRSYNPGQKGWDTFQKMIFFISYLFINTIFANPFPPKQCCGLGFLISGLSASRIKQLCNGGVRGGCKKSKKTQRSEN